MTDYPELGRVTFWLTLALLVALGAMVGIFAVTNHWLLALGALSINAAVFVTWVRRMVRRADS